MAALPYREKVIACERGGTYKYFLAAERVGDVWAAVVRRYGEIQKDAARATIEVVTKPFIVRSTLLGNPLTVFRKRACTAADIEELHALLEFREVMDG
ncbi:MAG: hypothetical protein H0V17_29980 [Deltaproteobacteria bacterium]|nr:hypothetical protein [Deltaproteobacteria bacterium]